MNLVEIDGICFIRTNTDILLSRRAEVPTFSLIGTKVFCKFKIGEKNFDTHDFSGNYVNFNHTSLFKSDVPIKETSNFLLTPLIYSFFGFNQYLSENIVNVQWHQKPTEKNPNIITSAITSASKIFIFHLLSFSFLAT